MKISEHIAATSQVPETLRRFGYDGALDPQAAIAWLRQHPLLDHELVPELEPRKAPYVPAFGISEQRTEQPDFRRRLMAAYGGRCAATGCAIPVMLEAAHLRAWRDSNETRHGILLRVDIHRLLDNGLISIGPDYVMRVDASVAESHWRELDGRKLRLPEKKEDHPELIR